MRTPIPEKFLDEISRNQGLRRYLDSLLEDRPHTPRSWLYDGYGGSRKLTPQQILDEWLAKLSTLETGTDFERNVYQFDISQVEKYGPQGGHAPVDKLLDDVVLPSFNPPEFSLNPEAFATDEWDWAVSTVIATLQRKGVHDLYPRAYERVVDDMRARDTLESNSGWPDFTRRKNPRVKQRAIEDAKSGAWRDYPAILLFRNYNGKTRQVWMFPMSTNIVEGSWFQPLTDAIMKTDLAYTFFSPWKGFDAVRSVLTASYEDVTWSIAASDFSSTDAHFQKAASKEVLKVLTALFKPQFAEALTESVMHMHEIPLIISPNEMLVGDHGVSSGSNWTNFIETIFDLIVGEYVKSVAFRKANHMRLPVMPLYAIGDDMAWIVAWNKDRWLRTKDSFPEFLEKIGKEVGQQIKAEKTMAEPNQVKTLQRLVQRNYSVPGSQQLRAVYSTVRALKSSVYPERMHSLDKGWKDYFCARQFMILENCVDHPLFEEFVKFICEGSVHLVPFARQSDKRLETLTREARLIPGLNPTYNQEKRDSSLANFQSIRIAREL